MMEPETDQDSTCAHGFKFSNISVYSILWFLTSESAIAQLRVRLLTNSTTSGDAKFVLPLLMRFDISWMARMRIFLLA